jgi:flagellar hook protein FlgE
MQTALNSAAAALNTSGTSLGTIGATLTGLALPAGAAATAAGTAATTAGTSATTAGTAVGTAMTAATASYNTANTDATASTTAFSTFYSASAAAFSKVTKVDPDGLITYVGKYGDTYYYSSTGAIGIPTSTATAAQVAAAQRIAVINPSNPGGMDKLGGTLFQLNATAGVPATGFSISNNKINGTTEKIFSNSLEQSNVDMAGQFVKMILTQRAYSANSKTITTADEMTQEALNLKR